MLVDDSIVVRSIIERIIEASGDFDIPYSVPTAADALEILSHNQVDIIVLDIEMPGMNGLAALPLLLQKRANAKIIVLSANCEDGGPAAIEAMARGACDTLVKPGKAMFAGNFGNILIERLRALGNIPAPRADTQRADAVATPRRASRVSRQTFDGRQADVIGIGASTGGIMAINGFLGALGADVDCPILITQHLPANFIPYFADQLARASGRQVEVAENGKALARNRVYVAPGEASIGLVKVHSGIRIALIEGVGPAGTCPAVDTMFTAMAQTYADRACGVVLSGMGKDGLEGARELRQAGGLIFAQDMESSTVWGMPGSITNANLADGVHNPMALAAFVTHAASTATKAA